MHSYRTTVSALGLATALLAGPAVASPFQLTAGAGPGGLTGTDLTGWVSFNGGAAEHVYVGPLNMTVTDTQPPGGSIQQTVYCTDIFDNFVAGGDYNLVPNGLATLGSVKLGQINALLAHTSPTGGVGGAAVQAAIWEIMNEPVVYNYSVQQPLFEATLDSPNDPAFQSTVATDLLKVSGTNGSGTDGTWQPDPTAEIDEYMPVTGQQNQSFGFITSSNGGNEAPLPEPGTLGLFGLGAVGLAAVRRRRRASKRLA